MKSVLIFLSFFLLSGALKAQIQFDTTNGRYQELVFDSVEVISDVQYSVGLNIAGQLQPLLLDIYQPYGDVETQRPVIVMVHGGSFVQGGKAELTLTCKHFAQKGYVAVSIDYRLGYSSFTPAAAVETVIRATQDLKNAIRFLRKSASVANPYKIHPDYIFAGGVSAGAITALHAAYMDQLNEILPGQTISSLDSLHNIGQIPGFDWKFLAVINIAGGIGDTNWIQQNDAPVISFHGTADATVPYEVGTFGGAFALYGSHPIFLRTQHLGIVSQLRPFPGAGHDYSLDNPSATDTTLLRITRFLLPFLIPHITSAEAHKTTATSLLYYTEHGWQVKSPDDWSEAQLYDLQGRLLKIIAPVAKDFLISSQKNTRILKLVNIKSEAKVLVLPGI